MKKLTKEELCPFTAQILDIFEDFLEEKGVTIDNPEKQDAIESGEDPVSICILYGTDFGELQSDIEGVLFAWDLVE